MKIVAYVRVSTKKQASSALGLEAQRDAIENYAAKESARVLASYTETESGKNDERPQLAKALHHAKITGATLVIAKLDRLSRKASFLFTLRDAGVAFLALDVPDANSLTLSVLIGLAQHERELISQRTRDALAAAKRRGTRLGNPNGARALRRARKGNAASIEAIKSKADAHALDLAPTIAELREQGVTALGALASALNDREVRTPRGGRWHKTSVRNLLARLG